jgi:hypothetical protein
MHTVKPHPLSLCGEWGSLGGSLYSAPTTVRQPGYLPPGEVHGLCAPASRRVCLYRIARAPERTVTIIRARWCEIHMPHGHLS